MLKNIKSYFISNKIFEYLDEGEKLKIIKYNKTLQKNLDITINNYKHFKGKYIIYESKGFGKEYNVSDEKLIFEGEIKHGQRNGKGKEYNYDGKLIFEGEYLNGKRNGKGKEHYHYEKKILDIIDIIIFEGEYLNNKVLNGTKFDKNGDILYKFNNINGQGKEYFDDGKLKFEGEYLNGKRNGKGKEYYKNGLLEFEGEYLNDRKWEGKGYDKYNKITYNLKDGNGIIKEYYDNGTLKFEGEYLNGKKNGKGKEYDYFNEKVRFEGNYLNGLRNGKGKEYYYDRNILFEGEYLNGLRNGKGKEYYYDGTLKYEGEYLYDFKIKGKFYINKKLIYDGEYLYNRLEWKLL